MHNKHSYKPHIQTYFEKGLRYDGRKLNELREVLVEKGVVATAEGSARVKIGNTEVIAGVKMELGTPYPDTPDEGSIMVNAELLPLSSKEFEPGPPGEEAIELARVVDRGIRESESLNLKDLCIKEGEKMWIVSVDVCAVNDDGSLLDASGLAALAAIEDAVFPEVVEIGEDKRMEVDYKHKTDKKVPISKRPIPVTVFKIGDQIIVDPIAEEQKLADSRLTVTSTEDGKLCALQKGGEGVFTSEEVSAMVELAIEKAKELRSKL
jgi:exosome complex component RRP42